MKIITTSQFSTTTAIAQVNNDGRLTFDLSIQQTTANQNYRILINDSGQILLDPFTNIPEQERWLWQNPDALASLQRGIQQAASDDLQDLGSFAKYADLDLDD